jgi:hypothetical protein
LEFEMVELVVQVEEEEFLVSKIVAYQKLSKK